MEGDVGYFEVDAVFNVEPVELLEESTWTARLSYEHVVFEWQCSHRPYRTELRCEQSHWNTRVQNYATSFAAVSVANQYEVASDFARDQLTLLF